MNKVSIYMAAIAFSAAFSACETDKEPVYHDPTSFSMATPYEANMAIDLTPTDTLALECTRPNYGYTAVTNYLLQVALDGSFETVEEVKPVSPTLPQMKIPGPALATAICNLHGYTNDNAPNEFDYEPVYLRAVAQISGLESSRIESNVVEFSQLKAYLPAPSINYLYTPGQANGWSGTASQMLISSNGTEFVGYAVLDPGGFKFTTAPDWNGTNYGAGASKGKLSTSGGNITVDQAGLYYCQVNIDKLTYTADYITTYGLIGDAVGGWENSVPLTPSANYLTWEADVTFTGGEFKFRANNDWAINLGGTITDLKADGNNIASPGSGTYHVVLQFATMPYTATFTKL
ncbi:MAG: SusF/SusE family outer membrane protein [Muribaculum sp.]|nr:SusF/SusE family outer membrane protein [Muribaculaceae bacterium]MCM1081173.1 SusF/SusE family outer membrane protein [Muribaculum sp.]